MDDRWNKRSSRNENSAWFTLFHQHRSRLLRTCGGEERKRNLQAVWTYLELAASLETDACINVLWCIISWRGQVAPLISDNGTNFIVADRELKEALAALNNHRTEGVLSQAGICWSFNPLAGSHHDGVWESMICLVRRTLSSVLWQQTLDDDGLHIVFCKMESILNDRPLTQLLDNPNDLEPLTPNHLLLLKEKPALPHEVFEPHDLYVRRRWRQVLYLSDLFWKQWVWKYPPLLEAKVEWGKQKEFEGWRCCRNYGFFCSSWFLATSQRSGGFSL